MTPEQKRAYNQAYYYAHQSEILAQKKSIYVPRTNRRRGRDLERARARVKRWRNERREHVRRVNQEWYRRLKSDPVAWAKHQQERREYQNRNRDEQNARCRAWSSANPEKRRLKGRRRKAKCKGAKGHFTAAQWQARLAYYGHCCAYCHQQLQPTRTTIDHVIPISCGGTNWPANLVPACSKCNSRKLNKRWTPHPVWIAPPRVKMSTS